MTIDERIRFIMEKVNKLSKKKPEFPCGEFPPKWDKPLTEEKVAAYEKEKGIKLPEDYRRFITTVASSGTQPFYGLYSPLGPLPSYETKPKVECVFPYTVRTPLDISALSDEEYDAIYGEEGVNEEESVNLDAGFLLLCTEGCGMNSILIVNSEDKDTYGTVWYYDLANDAGMFPLINPKNGKTMNFLDWLEFWVDKTLELPDSDYFGYEEIAGIIENV